MTRYLLAAVLLCLSSASIAKMYGDPAAYNRRGAAPAVTSFCTGNSGNVFQQAYSGLFRGPGGDELNVWINGQSVTVGVGLSDGRYLRGGKNIGPSDVNVQVPLTSPGGLTGNLDLCAIYLTQGTCSRFAAAVTVNGAMASGPQVYTRVVAPANISICVP